MNRKQRREILRKSKGILKLNITRNISDVSVSKSNEKSVINTFDKLTS